MKIILALLGIFIVVTLVRAIFFKEKKQEKEKLLPEMINMEKYCRDLSDAIKIKTISNKRFVIDMDNCDFIDSAGLGMLVIANDEMVVRNIKPVIII